MALGALIEETIGKLGNFCLIKWKEVCLSAVAWKGINVQFCQLKYEISLEYLDCRGYSCPVAAIGILHAAVRILSLFEAISTHVSQL